jgi:hypothetical protein
MVLITVWHHSAHLSRNLRATLQAITMSVASVRLPEWSNASALSPWASPT